MTHRWSKKALQAISTATNPRYVESFGRLYGQGLGAVMELENGDRNLVIGYLNCWERSKFKLALNPKRDTDPGKP